MTKEDYNAEIRNFEKEFEEKKKEVNRRYALSNNDYSVGDIFTDHIGNIKIESIGIYHAYPYPSCFYDGDNLLKSGGISKKEPKRRGYQQNAKK